jgi:hypothetical protein
LLLISLRNFSISKRRSEQRRPSHETLDPTIQNDSDTPQAIVEAQWVKALLNTVLEGMRHECERTHRMDVWVVFEQRILLQFFASEKPVDYAVLAQKLNLASPIQAANLLVTGKRMYARLLRSAIGEYELAPDEVEEELNDLKLILQAKN